MKQETKTTSILKYIIIGVIYLLIFALITLLIISSKKNQSPSINNEDKDKNTTINSNKINSENKIISQKLIKDNNEVIYSYNVSEKNTYDNLKLTINNNEIDFDIYPFLKENYNNIDIKLYKDYLIIETIRQNTCKSKFYTLYLMNYEGKITFISNSQKNDIQFTYLSYDGSYKYDEQANIIELNYTLPCDIDCYTCASIDSQGNIIKDIYSMTCDELDYVLNNSTGKISTKLTLEGEEIIESITQKEKLKDDQIGYNNNLKNKLDIFYQEKCSNS